MTLVIDLYSGPGGVGYALAELGYNPIGVDIVDHGDTYPGEFIRGDASRPPVDVKPDLLWLSPPCTAYSTLSNSNKHRLGFDDPREYYPTFDDLRVREVIEELDPLHYVIENVATCEDLRDPVRLNGMAFGKPYRLERHFETSFPVPSHALVGGDPDVPLNTRNGGGRTQSIEDLADAKGVPADWGKQGVRSAIPSEYVRFLLHFCPVTPDVPYPDVVEQRRLAADGGGLLDADRRSGAE